MEEKYITVWEILGFDDKFYSSDLTFYFFSSFEETANFYKEHPKGLWYQTRSSKWSLVKFPQMAKNPQMAKVRTTSIVFYDKSGNVIE